MHGRTLKGSEGSASARGLGVAATTQVKHVQLSGLSVAMRGSLVEMKNRITGITKEDLPTLLVAIQTTLEKDYQGFAKLRLMSDGDGGYAFRLADPGSTDGGKPHPHSQENRVPIKVYQYAEAAPVVDGHIVDHDKTLPAPFAGKESDWPLFSIRISHYAGSNSVVIGTAAQHGVGGFRCAQLLPVHIYAHFIHQKYGVELPDWVKEPVHLLHDAQLPTEDKRADRDDPRFQDKVTGEMPAWQLVPALVRTIASMGSVQPVLMTREVDATDGSADRGSASDFARGAYMTLFSRTLSLLGKMAVAIATIFYATSPSLKCAALASIIQLVRELNSTNVMRIVADLRRKLALSVGAADNLVDFSACIFSLLQFMRGELSLEALTKIFQRVIERAGPEGRVEYQKTLAEVTSTDTWFASLAAARTGGALSVAATDWSLPREVVAWLQSLPAEVTNHTKFYCAQTRAGLKGAGPFQPNLIPEGLLRRTHLSWVGDSKSITATENSCGVSALVCLQLLASLRGEGPLHGVTLSPARDAYLLPGVRAVMCSRDALRPIGRIAQHGQEMTLQHTVPLFLGNLLYMAFLFYLINMLANGLDSVCASAFEAASPVLGRMASEAATYVPSVDELASLFKGVCSAFTTAVSGADGSEPVLPEL